MPKKTQVTHDTWESTSEDRFQLLPRIRSVAFFGYADAKPESKLYKDAYETAKLLASKGLTIVDGGGPGVMDAATKGAHSVNGETVAVTFYPQNAPGFEGRYLGNIASKEVVTRNYIERMFKLMEHADAFIIFNGGTGTISEFGTAWVLARLYFGHHKPFLLFGSFWREIIAVIEKNMKMRGNENDVFKIVETSAEAEKALLDFNAELVELEHQEYERLKKIKCRGKK